MNEDKGICIYSDNHELGLEICGKARELADKLQAQLTAVIIGENIQEKAQEFLKVGANEVHVYDDPALRNFQAEPYLSLIQEAVLSTKPEVVLIGSTKNGKPLAARLSIRLDVGCVPDCIRLNIQDERLIGERLTYGGNATAKISFKKRPQIATIPSRAFEKPQPQNRNGEILRKTVKLEPSKTEIVQISPLETSNVKIEDAQVIISCGRGLAKKEDKILLDELAKVLCGQVGCSRPLSEDRKWFSEWIGLSGHKVKPKLYMACGISGVIQHIAGIRDAKLIVAVNKDPEAPIFEIADYGVVGDLYQILPSLKESLEKQLR